MEHLPMSNVDGRQISKRPRIGLKTTMIKKYCPFLEDARKQHSVISADERSHLAIHLQLAHELIQFDTYESTEQYGEVTPHLFKPFGKQASGHSV